MISFILNFFILGFLFALYRFLNIHELLFFFVNELLKDNDALLANSISIPNGYQDYFVPLNVGCKYFLIEYLA